MVIPESTSSYILFPLVGKGEGLHPLHNFLSLLCDARLWLAFTRKPNFLLALET